MTNLTRNKSLGVMSLEMAADSSAPAERCLSVTDGGDGELLCPPVRPSPAGGTVEVRRLKSGRLVVAPPREA